MEAEHFPAIQVIAFEEHGSTSSPPACATGFKERPGLSHSMRQRPPSPSPQASSMLLNDTLAPEYPGAPERPLSAVSCASSITLSGVQANALPSTPENPTYFSGPLTAEPESIIAGISEGDPEESKKPVFLAPTPATFCHDLRYERRERLDLNKLKTFFENIPAKNAIPARPESLGEMGWKQYTHPEGNSYFRHKNFYTNTWLHDELMLKRIEIAVELILTELRNHSDISQEGIEVGLELSQDEVGDILGCYYLVDIKTESTFWLHEIPACLLSGTDSVKILGREHLNRVEDLKSDLNYFLLDKQTSKSSTAPYNVKDARSLVQIIKEIRTEPNGPTRPQQVVIVCRLMATIFRERFIRYHGEPYAQLDSDRSVYQETHQGRHLWFRMFSWISFWTPQIYHDRLSKTWVDSKVNYDQWGTFIGELQKDWEASITPSTVILTANVSFLAIQSVDDNGVVIANRSMGQIVSYISTMLTIGNIVACTILTRQHRQATHQYAEAAAGYLSSRAESKVGLEVLAILFSIPTVFFAWGLLTFLIAIIWVCLWGTSVATRISVCVVIGIGAFLIAWIVRNGDWQAQQSVSTLSAKMKRMHKLVKKVPRRMATGLRTLSSRAMIMTRWSLAKPLSARRSRWSGPVSDPSNTPGDVGIYAIPLGDEAV
ncbi:hypothetical protein BD309DRAFT_873994 [Dichomitus squalens]|uniref:Uncharacterized protein n=1 Tax=Dichomitus squalens TaxID=114155 RepID=A0A4Q9PAD3_9APHY|nr:hypothetical protein BD309DRAFT_873994 [Dichomitus squalens]TBU51650.1 hypothetical protein BD310DRAFT_982412 [Dichomitus squalens]